MSFNKLLNVVISLALTIVMLGAVLFSLSFLGNSVTQKITEMKAGQDSAYLNGMMIAQGGFLILLAVICWGLFKLVKWSWNITRNY